MIHSFKGSFGARGTIPHHEYDFNKDQTHIHRAQPHLLLFHQAKQFKVVS